METALKLQIKSVYGVERIYPACDQSRKLAKLLDRKTFTSANVDILQELGFNILFIGLKTSAAAILPKNND